MTNQYKRMLEKKEIEISTLNAQVEEQENTIKQRDEEYANMCKEKESIIQQKGKEISDLKTNIEQMSSEFARMLKETLEKMQERIELAQWDNNDHEVTMLRKLKDISGAS